MLDDSDPAGKINIHPVPIYAGGAAPFFSTLTSTFSTRSAEMTSAKGN
jgi:hypothetical protein